MMALVKMAFGAVAGGWQKWAAIAGAVVLLAGYIGWLKWDIADYRATVAEQAGNIKVLTKDLNTAQQVNQRNVAALADIQESARKTTQALSNANARATKAQDRVIAIERGIASVPTDQDCKLGPAVRSVLERLWADPAAKAVH